MARRPFDEEFTPQSPWLDLVNSEHWDGLGCSTDHLLDPTWVKRYLRYFEHPAWTPGPSQGRRQLSKLRRLLREVTEQVAGGGRLGPGHVEAMNDLLRSPACRQLSARGGRVHMELRPLRGGWGWIRAQIVASFIESLERHAGRIKVCANPQCRWAFLDTTKSNIRRWCRDRRCGNRDRVRRARERAKNRRS